MLSLIVGQKGKGKTKYLLEKVNEEIKTATGHVVYLDKNVKHMYEVNNRVRMINVSDYDVRTNEEFVGFLLGIISQDHDLSQVYLDSFLDIAHIKEDELSAVFERLNAISKKFSADFVISVGVDEKDLPAAYKENIIVSL